jgi:hypothetical protein
VAKPTENVDEYTIRVAKFNDHMWKALKAEGVAANAPIFEGMNTLIVKHYMMGFHDEIC